MECELNYTRKRNDNMIVNGLDDLISDASIREKMKGNSHTKTMHLLNNFMMRLPEGFLYDIQDKKVKAKIDEAIIVAGINPEKIRELNLQRYNNKHTATSEQAEEELFEVTYPVYCVMRSLGYERTRLL